MRRIVILSLVGVVSLGIILVAIIQPKNKNKENIDIEEINYGGGNAFLEKAKLAENKGQMIEAKQLYEKAMMNIDDVSELKNVQNKIEQLNLETIFSSRMDDCSINYVVKPNDVLINISKKFKTTVNLIKRANNLNSDIIKPGQGLKINNCEFSVVVDKSQNLLFLKRAGDVIKTYIVSTGKNNCTPIGNFKIINKLENPTWYKTGEIIEPNDPDNLLGTRWMGFDLESYGIHGTNKPEELGLQITLGCVRMRNGDVEEVFDIVPTGTEVLIVD